MKYYNSTTFPLGEIAFFSNEKIEVEKITEENYISTENMLPNKGGITKASNLPDAKKVGKYDHNDILISNIRPYFKKIWFSNTTGGASNDVLIIKNKNTEKVDDKFLYYCLSNNDFFDYVTATSKGTKMPRGDKDAIMQYKIPLPEITEQRAISEILSTLDYKIELNNRIKNKLEVMAQSIFKHWFIDFEFINDEGQSYKSSGGEMIECEINSIPKGWKVIHLKEILSIKHGYAFKSKDFSKEKTNLLILTPGNFKVGGGFKREKFKYLEPKTNFPSEYVLKRKDLIVTMTDLSRDGDTLGYPAFVPLDNENQYLHNQRLGKVILKKPFSKLFLYFLFCSANYRNYVLGTSTGTTVKHTSPKTIEEFKFVAPTQDILRRFENTINNILEKYQLIDYENIVLAEIRESLLPKLMSGDIRVPIVESFE